MIIDSKSLSLAEASELMEQVKEGEQNEEMLQFIKNFSKISSKEAKSLREELEKMDLIKIKAEHITKIIDLLPEDEVDVSKIFVDSNLNKEEVERILEVVKKYR